MEPTETGTLGADVPADVRALLELVAERLNIGSGVCRLVVNVQDGRVRFLTRQERIKGTDLERF